MYDLTLIPIHTLQGQPLQQIPGFKAFAPPRRAVRSRTEDLLIVSLITEGGASISLDELGGWLYHLAQNFFKISGSVTSALRSLIETLNLTMMEKNLKLAQEGGWRTGMINLAAVHRRSLYIAQSGQAHAYTLTHGGLQHFHDTGMSDRGIGLSRTPAIRFFQADLGTGGYLFMTDSPPDTWYEDLLLADGFPSQEKLRRRLLNQAPVDFRLDLIQIQPGEGQIKVQSPAARSEARPPDAKVEASPDQKPFENPVGGMPVTAVPGSGQQDTQEVKVLEHLIPEESSAEEPQATGGSQSLDEPGEERVSITPDRPAEAEGSHRRSQQDAPLRTDRMEPAPTHSPGQSEQRIKTSTKQVREEGLHFLAGFFDWWHTAWGKVGHFFDSLISRVMPEGTGETNRLSRSALLWISVLVPVVVVAIALGVYLSRGRRLQYENFLAQAQAAAQTALAAEDPNVKRSAWYQALDALDQAEDISRSEEAVLLRQDAENALDILDGALRLAYQPALRDTLSSSINISEIVSYGLDLYLFDGASGWVIHAMRDNDIYDVDTDFLCAPGNYSGGALSAIADIVSLPINNPYQAHILAIDEIGNVAYCSPGQDPVVQTLPGLGEEASEGIRNRI